MAFALMITSIAMVDGIAVMDRMNITVTLVCIGQYLFRTPFVDLLTLSNLNFFKSYLLSLLLLLWMKMIVFLICFVASTEVCILRIQP